MRTKLVITAWQRLGGADALRCGNACLYQIGRTVLATLGHRICCHHPFLSIVSDCRKGEQRFSPRCNSPPAGRI